MKQIPLTQGYFATIDDEDYELVNRYNWIVIIQRRSDASISRIHAYAKINNETIYMHRLILNAPFGLDVDHKDGNGLNNQRNNLRIATREQNIASGRFTNYVNKSSKYRGVTWDKFINKWKVRVGKVNIGRYKSEEEAAREYDRVALKFYGEFAVLNFPTDKSDE